MKLGLINASPRGINSNSTKILGWLTKEMPSDVEKTFVYAVKAENQKETVAAVKDCDYYVIIFPLYTDAMPGIAKKFFENMMEKKAYFAGKPVLFIIHSGFPEAVQSRMAERYARHFANLMEMQTMGSIIVGNSEGIRRNPKQASSKRAQALAEIGKRIPQKRPLTAEESVLPGQMETMPGAIAFLFRYIAPLMDSGWHGMMKQNGAYKNRLDRPLE